jgi:cell division protein FtsX
MEKLTDYLARRERVRPVRFVSRAEFLKDLVYPCNSLTKAQVKRLAEIGG